MNLPPYTSFPVLSNERIILRCIELSDIPQIVEISFYDGKQAICLKEAITIQKKIMIDYFNKESIHWGIIDKETNSIVGTCGYYRGFENEKGELGCVLLTKFRSQGFMTEALKLAIAFGLETIELSAVWAATNRDNLKARKLLERIQFKSISYLDDYGIIYQFINEK